MEKFLKKLYIAGFGVGDVELLTGRVKGIISAADRVLSTYRISSGLPENKNIKNCTLTELLTELDEPNQGVTVVLVSGDCGFFSVSKRIVEKFTQLYDIELINGISSIQYFSAKIAVTYDDAVICSMHGRDANIVPRVAYNKKVFALTGGAYKAHDICERLFRSGLGDVQVQIAERLSYPDERIIKDRAGVLMGQVFDELSVMYIENNSYVNPHLPLSDEDFIRGDVPMTKAEVRWLSIQKLAIEPGDVVYDIGAGTGSVSVEMARRAFEGFVYAIEMKDEACKLVEMNRKKHGAYNIEIVRAKAPEALDALPKPDKVFIGGSSGGLPEILKILISKNPEVRIVSNAITLQSVQQVLESYEKFELHERDIICVNISKARKIKTYDLMTAQNPVYIMTAASRRDTYE